MNPSYEVIAWLQPGSDFDLNMAEAHLRKYFPVASLFHDEHSLTLDLDGWTARLYLSEAPHVALEAQEFPAVFPNCPRNSEIVGCRRRVELVCSLNDPGMEHFNDFVFVCQAIEQFRGSILFDPLSGQLI